MKRFFQLTGVLAGLLIIAMIYNTLTFQSISSEEVEDVQVELVNDGIAERFAGAIRIPTVSHQKVEDINYPSFLTLHQYIDANFPEIAQSLQKIVINDYSLLYKWQGSDLEAQPVLLLSHMDVVPVVAGSESRWEHPPYSGAIADGYIWGRGTLDNKQGVFAILEAVEDLLTKGYQPRRTYYLAFGHDEERGGVQGAGKIAEYLKSKNVNAIYALDEGGFITNGDQFGLPGKIAMVNISEKGIVNLKLTVTGEGGHSSMPPAETAAAILSQAVVKVSANKLPVNTEPVKQMLASVAGDLPLNQRVAAANFGLLKPFVTYFAERIPMLNAFVRTTTAPTMLQGSPKSNVLPTEAVAIVNHRIIPGETGESVKDFITKVIDDERVNIEFNGGFSNPSEVASVDSVGFEIIRKTIKQVSPTDPIILTGMLPAATDTRHYGDVSDDAYRFIYAEINMSENRFHGTNERIKVESYLEAVRFFVQLIKNSDGAESDPGW
jgi:carboxypeptidase PM20D1